MLRYGSELGTRPPVLNSPGRTYFRITHASSIGRPASFGDPSWHATKTQSACSRCATPQAGMKVPARPFMRLRKSSSKSKTQRAKHTPEWSIPSSGTAYSKEDSRSAASLCRSLKSTSKKSRTRFQPTACSSSTSRKAGNHFANSSQSRFPTSPFPVRTTRRTLRGGSGGDDSNRPNSRPARAHSNLFFVSANTSIAHSWVPRVIVLRCVQLNTL